jgi:hypothetical protein
MIRQFEQRWKCGKGSSLFAKFAQADLWYDSAGDPPANAPKGVLPPPKPLRSCHKRLESVAAPTGPETCDRFRGQRGSPRAFRCYDKSLFLSISYWKTLGGRHAAPAAILQL